MKAEFVYYVPSRNEIYISDNPSVMGINYNSFNAAKMLIVILLGEL